MFESWILYTCHRFNGDLSRLAAEIYGERRRDVDLKISVVVAVLEREKEEKKKMFNEIEKVEPTKALSEKLQSQTYS